ncbi:translation initiation factor IF-3 [candidate division WWE3 bacterium]|nr:translation initiation factor IF-3 [candidate division WWE3 bacterium]
MSYDKRYQINERIRSNELRVITKDGENLGILPTRDAITEAKNRNLDLVVVSEGATPPIAKILDFNKFLYDESKKASAAKAKSKKSELKEFKFGPHIGEGDINTRIERSREFLLDGNRVRITVQLRGREKAFPEVGFEKIAKFTAALSDIAKTEENAKQIGGEIKTTFIKK